MAEYIEKKLLNDLNRFETECEAALLIAEKQPVADVEPEVLPMAKRLIVLDYDAVRKAFDEEFKSTRKLIESGETHLDNLAEGFTEADRVLRKMLTEDVVEVVRCRDCKHQETSKCPTYHVAYFSEKESWELDGDDDFCSYGTRKEAADDAL